MDVFCFIYCVNLTLKDNFYLVHLLEFYPHLIYIFVIISLIPHTVPISYTQFQSVTYSSIQYHAL
jgi:hypothetical protein